MELDELHETMLAAIPEKYQKTVGFPAYDFTRAFALAVLSLAGDVETAESHLDVTNLTDTDLDTWVWQHRGITRRFATYATATLRVVTGAGEIQAGSLFATESGVEFFSTSDGTYAEGDTFEVQAYEAGNAGNVAAGTIAVMPVPIPGIAAVVNDAAASGGYDGEPDDDLRDRYLEDLQNPNNGGNIQAYVSWALSVPGVGRVKVFPLANGINTVEVCIVDASMEPADSGLIAAVQAVVDPNHNGDGTGMAPIGAICTVTTAQRVNVSLSVSVTLARGTTTESVRAAIREEVTAYLRDFAFSGDDTYISYAKISSCISAADGVLDHTGLLVNGGTAHIPLGVKETPVLSEVNIT